MERKVKKQAEYPIFYFLIRFSITRMSKSNNRGNFWTFNRKKKREIEKNIPRLDFLIEVEWKTEQTVWVYIKYTLRSQSR